MIPKYLQRPKGPLLENDNREAVIAIRQRTQYKNIMSLYRKAHTLCERCLASNELKPAECVHHIIEVSDGGPTEDANLLSVCKPCHDEIHRLKVSRAMQRTWKEEPMHLAF